MTFSPALEERFDAAPPDEHSRGVENGKLDPSGLGQRTCSNRCLVIGVCYSHNFCREEILVATTAQAATAPPSEYEERWEVTKKPNCRNWERC